jgi:hypothetical protein
MAQFQDGLAEAARAKDASLQSRLAADPAEQ